MSKCKIALKFCGCCNPYVDLSQIAYHLRTAIESCDGFDLVPLASRDIDVVVILCGCPRACANRAENRTGRLATVVVAGESVDGEPIPESELGVAVGQKLAMVLDRWKRGCDPCS